MDNLSFRLRFFDGSVGRFLMLRCLLIAGALSVAPLVRILPGSDSGSGLFLGGSLLSNPYLRPVLSSVVWLHSNENVNVNVNVCVNVVEELMGMRMLSDGANSLFVGEGSGSVVMALRNLGLRNVVEVHESFPLFSLNRKKLGYELDFENSSFDFVLTRGLEKVAVPALLVLEIERVLRPGGIGAMVVDTSGTDSDPNSLIRSATPISSYLKASTIVNVGHMGQYSLVVFRKNFDIAGGYFEKYQLPADCQSITNNKAFMANIEPLVEDKQSWFEGKVEYLPKLVDVSHKKRLVYIEIGAGKHLNPNASNWFLPKYPMDHRAFSVYFVDHDPSVIVSYVKTPGINFVYHPGLATNASMAEAKYDASEEPDPYTNYEGFDFLLWFKETVQFADFVVLKMNAGAGELKFLLQLYESGAICSVDELFLHCSNHHVDQDTVIGRCMDLFKSLRSTGVYVHQWWAK